MPYTYDTVVEQLDSGEIDVALGGLIMNPERLLRAGFTQPYQTATMAVVLPDHRRGEFDTWDDPHMPTDCGCGAIHEDLAAAARRQLPNAEVVVIDSIRSLLRGRPSSDLDGLDHGRRGRCRLERAVPRTCRCGSANRLCSDPSAWRCVRQMSIGSVFSIAGWTSSGLTARSIDFVSTGSKEAEQRKSRPAGASSAMCWVGFLSVERIVVDRFAIKTLSSRNDQRL